MKGGDEQVDGLDAKEGDEDASDAVDEQISLEDFRCTQRAEFYSTQGERNQQDDNNRVKDDCAKDGALR